MRSSFQKKKSQSDATLQNFMVLDFHFHISHEPHGPHQFLTQLSPPTSTSLSHFVAAFATSYSPANSRQPYIIYMYNVVSDWPDGYGFCCIVEYSLS